MFKPLLKRALPALAGLALLFLAGGVYAADACKHRGELDVMYCDDNNDMVADVPTDSKKWKNPSTIVFTYTPVEDPAVYENIFKPFTTALGKCLDKKVVFYQVQSNAAEIEAMRSGRLRGSVRGQGHGEGVPGLQPDRDRQSELALPEAFRPQGQEGRAYIPLVELRSPRAAGAVPW